MTSPVIAALGGFDAIDLATLDARSALMVRRDSKYLVSQRQLLRVLEQLGGAFEALRIDGSASFAYHSDYFDSPDLHCFRDHNQNRRRRLKVRFRHYADAGLHFMEVKVKRGTGETAKVRCPISAADYQFQTLPEALRGYLAEAAPDMFEGREMPSYGKMLRVSYQRSTLVARVGEERITLDNQLHFATVGGRSVTLPSWLWVVEVKSRIGRSPVDRLLRQAGAWPAELCSKYCVGLSIADTVSRVTRFTPMVKKILALGPG